MPAWISLWGRKALSAKPGFPNSSLVLYLYPPCHPQPLPKSISLHRLVQSLFFIDTYALCWYNQLVLLKLYVCAFFCVQPTTWMWPPNCRVWSQLYSAFHHFHCYIHIINEPTPFSVIVADRFPDQSFSPYNTHSKCRLRHNFVSGFSQTYSWLLLHLYQMIHLWAQDIPTAELPWYPYLWCLNVNVIFKR